MPFLLPVLLSTALAAPPGSTAVVGGSTPAPNEWPSVAAFAYGSGYVACTGVLIHPEWVLTAGHCAPNPTSVYLDTIDLSGPGEVREVDAFLSHPDAFSTYDVALAHLSTPSQVEPANLALDCIATDFLRPEAPVTVVGFGAIDEWAQENAESLQAADTTIRDPDCDDEYAGCNIGAMPAGELLAGGDGVDSCTGDSGGPLFLKAGGLPWVVGTTARAIAPADTPCGGGGIYVRTDAVADWIEQTADIALPRPSCDGLNRPPKIAVEDVVLPMNGEAWIQPLLEDVNLDQQLTLELLTPPEHGWASVVGHEVFYLPGPNYFGPDSLQLRVVDDGVPAESSTATVSLSVRSQTAPPPSGCDHAPGRLSASWLLLLLGLRRHRARR